ncbi:MAG: hypothetical protein PHW73_01825 [Atribacterota bacterium]|nr:hypothetical protein [Atribacterota bacterium]
MQNNFNIPTYPEHDIAEYIESYHKGLSHAVSNSRLAEVFQLDKRTLRRIITKLINEYGLPLGSSSTRGIFFISSDKECLLAMNELKSRREELEIREANIDTNWFNYKNEQIEQLELIK